ncbi:glycogen debranching enzyme family protein [Telmatocola sphagniphila]|uniref:Glycogen debranching enzyme family protein n=1 Tax=Telmatocola sphagniphila TaxID=1123043 RepID=A0A8E6B862_9BACT|nr:amylo-alpha-1,6-glucosidase [Telmatocola sphagniphila]QVL33526.1 glycogen debranching enzyme family protein [Telmatocola sphagniphila]
MTDLNTNYTVRDIQAADLMHSLDREWLVTNGLGGYASGTISGAATRRYHGLLIAAHPAPLGRLMMFNHLAEQFRFPDWSVASFGGIEKVDSGLDIHGADILSGFRLEEGLPIWTFVAHDHVIEKRLFMPNKQNTVHLIYRLLKGEGPVRLKLRPSVHFRDHDAPVSIPMRGPYTLTATEGRYEMSGETSEFPRLRMRVVGNAHALTLDGMNVPNILYRVEENRGYDGVGTLYSMGLFRANLNADQEVTLTASTESWDRLLSHTPSEALQKELERRRRVISISSPALRHGFGAELALAADQFIITPVSRTADTAKAEASGDEARTIIAGYHWFTDWGRDTMISLEGLTLVTGRHLEAGYILRTFASHVRNGLIPNYFPDGSNQGVYHTADATLWFFHALSRYEAYTRDHESIRNLIPTLKTIVAKHLAGTDYGIGVDPKDKLLKQGAEGYQLTWMDAKVGDWVVTPRRGKTVEINALWYNALCLMNEWLKRENDPEAASMGTLAAEVKRSFNDRFWNPEQKYLFDLVDGEHGNDPACRPNQIFAISLPHPVLNKEHWPAILGIVEKELLTPVGLRSLSPNNPEYKSKYYGDLRSRDAAYHQGTVWAWLIGPFIDAWRKLHSEKASESSRFLRGFESHLSEACIGSISEVFDAEEPFTPRACIAQAWSVGEVARCMVLDDVKEA